MADALVPERTRQSLLTGALRELAFSVQAMELYPPESPVVKEAVDRARTGLAPLVAHGPLTLEVLPATLMVDDQEVGEGHTMLRKLARKLHFRRVARLRLEPPLPAAGLMALAQGTAMDRGELEAAGGIGAFLTQFRTRGIHVELLSLDHLFDEDGEAVEDEDVWDRMLRRFCGGEDDPDLDWTELAVDPEQLAAFLAWVLDNATSVDELSGYSTVDLLRNAIERVGTTAPGSGADRLAPLAEAFDILCDELSSEAQIELLSEPLILPEPHAGEPADAGASRDHGGTGRDARRAGRDRAGGAGGGPEGVGAGSSPEGGACAAPEGGADGSAAVDDGGASGSAAAEEGGAGAGPGTDGGATDEGGGNGSGGPDGSGRAAAGRARSVDASGLGSGLGANGSVDATAEIARQLSAPRVEDLIVYAIHTRQQKSGRLVQLFSRLMSDRQDRSQIAAAVGRTIRGKDGSPSGPLLEDWPNLHDVLLGETPEPYVSKRYAATLEHLETQPSATADLWPLERIRPRFREMEQPFLLRRKCTVLLSLLEQERDPAEYADLAIELEKALPEFVLHEEYGLVEQVLGAFAGHTEPAADRPPAQRDIAGEVLARFSNRHTLLQLVRSLTGKPSPDMVIGMRIFHHLGSRAIPALLSALWQEKSRPGRLLLLRVLTSMGEDVVPEIEKHLEDERWFVVRNLVWIIRELGDPELINPLRLTVRHPDPRVRRESVLALGKIGGREAAGLLLLCIEDENHETQLDAIRGVGLHGLRQAIPRLRPNLELPNWHGQNSDVLEATIVALARLEDREVIPQLRQLARRRWLFPGRRRLVRDAARWALQNLDATERSVLDALRDRVTGWLQQLADTVGADQNARGAGSADSRRPGRPAQPTGVAGEDES